jgi:hypothetical protein
MKKMILTNALISVFTMVTIFAMTGSVALAGDANKGVTPPRAPAQSISWEEFQGRCADPASFNQQVAPANITIQCTDVSTDFVPEAPGALNMASSRSISAQLTSDKWVVGGIAPEAMNVPEKGGSCLRYKEVAKTLTIEHSLSCSDILGLKGSINDYCQSSLDSSKGSNPKLGSVVDTGRVIDTCAGLSELVPAGDNKAGK